MEQTAEHPFDERSKSFYTHYFENLQIRADRQFEVFSRGRSIDLLTECAESDWAKLQPTCFSHFRRVNAIEFKGPHDPLAIVPKNYPLLPLARGQKLRQFIDLCLENEWSSYLQFIIDIAKSIDPSEVFVKIMETLHMTYKLRPEFVLQFDQFLRDRPEMLSEMPTWREAVERASHIAALRAEQEGEKRGKLQEKQHSLTLLLQHKFPDVPATVLARVQETNDLVQLEQWTLQILTATTWQEMFGEAITA